MNHLDGDVCNHGRPEGTDSRIRIENVEEKLLQVGGCGLHLLIEAHDFAQELHRTAWAFAVELADLQERGLTSCDLRWLICMGYLEQTQETTPDHATMTFLQTRSLSLGKKSCFVLTEAGFVFARSVLDRSEQGNHRASNEKDNTERNRNSESKGLVPTWDRDRKELRLGSSIVKQFKVPAPNQEMILTVFQEEGWPERIDDPLPPRPELDPIRRLRDTINSLNRSQKNSAVRFVGEIRGFGVRWHLIHAANVEKNRGSDFSD